MDKATLNSMFDNLLHIWNKTNHWNPKMKEFIYASTNGVHVFNLLKTSTRLDEVKKELSSYSSQGKKILFVATKLQARDAFAWLAVDTGNYFVNEKWVPGLLTNFKTIRGRINTYLRILKESQTGGLDMLSKKDKATKLLELEKLDRAFKWLKEMKRLPDVIFVVDGAYELQAVKEANSLNIPAFALANTNSNPDLLTDFIPANTNSIKSIEFVAKSLTSVCKTSGSPSAGKNMQKIQQRKPLTKKPEAAKKAIPVETKAPVVKAAASEEKKVVSDKPDDLTKVEWIGPKIAETLVNAWISTYADLSKKKAEEISELITEIRGSHITDTWPKQASLAAEGKWDELKKWQDELDWGKPA